MRQFAQRMRRRGGWLVVPLLIAAPFLMSFVGLGTTTFDVSDGDATIPASEYPPDLSRRNRVQREGHWFLVGEPVAKRQSCDGDDLCLYRDGLTGIDAVVWADCEVTWVDGRRGSNAEAEGLDRCS